MIIRRDQQLAFERSATERFERAALEHLRNELPDRITGLSDDHVRAWIRGAIPRANSFDLKTEREIMCFLDAEALLGENFYNTEEHAWASQVLGSRELNAQDKSGILLATACSVYRDRTPESKGRTRV